jgi:hypothetical protein
MLNGRLIERLLLSCGVVLGGCSGAELAQYSTPPGAAEISQPNSEISQPNYRRIVADNIKEIFPKEMPPGEMEISPLRMVDHLKGAAWLTCLKVDSSGSLPLYAIFIQADKIIDVRVGVIKDECRKQPYAPFEIAREATPVQSQQSGPLKNNQKKSKNQSRYGPSERLQPLSIVVAN